LKEVLDYKANISRTVFGIRLLPRKNRLSFALINCIMKINKKYVQMFFGFNGCRIDTVNVLGRVLRTFGAR
jgi:hypothetical protein